MQSNYSSRGVRVGRVQGQALRCAGALLGALLALLVTACRIGTSECTGEGETSGALRGDAGDGSTSGEGGAGAGGGRATGGGGEGGTVENLCAHFGEDCIADDGAPGKVGALNAKTCVCCSGCFGQVDGRCQTGLLNFACGLGGEVCGDCMSKGCGTDQKCHTTATCYDDGVILPNGTDCEAEGEGPGHCMNGVCMPAD